VAKKYYVVWKGATTGIFDNWNSVKAATAGRSDAQYMGFTSEAQAKAAFAASYTKALAQRALEKGTSNNTPSKSVKQPPSVASEQGKHHSSTDIAIYSDGACSPNPGASGTGIAIYQNSHLTELWYGLYNANGTNNTAELKGLLAAFKLSKGYIEQNLSVEILSDSKYSIDAITKWATGWQRKGWKKANGEAIKNPELVQACFELYQTLKNKVKITHVKVHANIEGNELSDRMAVCEIQG
jgi:ribonuclease HI